MPRRWPVWGFVPAYRKRRIEAEEERRASSLRQQAETEREKNESKDYAYRDRIIAAIQDISHQSTVAQHQHNAYEDRKYKWERRRFFLDVTAIIVAAAGAYFLLRQQNTMQGQLAEMRDEHRPWVSFENMNAIPAKLTFSDDDVFSDAIVEQRNGGASVAVGDSSFQMTVVGEPPFEEGKPVRNGEVVRDRLAKEYGFRCDKDFVRGVSSITGAIVLPGAKGPSIPILPRQLPGTPRMERRYFRPDSGGNVTVWDAICIAYLDEFNLPHGTLSVVQFRTTDNKTVFPPTGTIEGSFFFIGVGASAY